MKTEVSAGGIIIRKASQYWEVLLLKDMNDNWTFPKGLIESEESPQQAAKREISEEVGLHEVTLIAPLTPIHYTYTRGMRIQKTVHYFVFTTPGKEVPVAQKEEGISEIAWFPLAEARSIVGYPETNKKLLEETNTIATKL